MKKKGEAKGDLDRQICPQLQVLVEELVELFLFVAVQGGRPCSQVSISHWGMSSIAWSQDFRSGSSLKFSFENRSWERMVVRGNHLFEGLFSLSTFMVAASSLA